MGFFQSLIGPKCCSSCFPVHLCLNTTESPPPCLRASHFWSRCTFEEWRKKINKRTQSFRRPPRLISRQVGSTVCLGGRWNGQKITLQATQATRPQSHSRGAGEIVFWGDIMRGFGLALITDSRGRGIKGLARADNDVRKLLKTK